MRRNSETPIALRPRGIHDGYAGCARCAPAGRWANLLRADPHLRPDATSAGFFLLRRDFRSPHVVNRKRAWPLERNYQERREI